MTVDIEIEYDKEQLDKELDFDYRQVANSVVEAVLDEEGCPYEASVDILLTDEAAIQDINRENRSMDQVTDVLSFPMSDFAVPGDFSLFEKPEMWDCFEPETGELILGDIVLCIPRVLSQAQEFGHSRKREYAFLIAHSMLHLIGYDHMTPEDASKMEAKQTQILDSLGIKREGV